MALPIFWTNKAIESKRNIPTWVPKEKYHSCNSSHHGVFLHRSIPNPLLWVHESVGAPIGSGVIKMEMAQVLWSKQVKQQVSIFLMRLLQLCGIEIDLAFLIRYFFQEHLHFPYIYSIWTSYLRALELFARAIELSPTGTETSSDGKHGDFYREHSDFFRNHSDFFPRVLGLFPSSPRVNKHIIWVQ